MDKVTINNQVVHMRKFVKQAIIRAINNYTKEIRKLQNRKGNDEETSKHKRKAERLLLKVEILKKIQPDTISRKALLKERDWNAVLKEKNISLQDQCYALLANYATVQSEVEKFHKKYWDLVPKLATLFKDWEEKSKDPVTKQQKKKAKELRKSMKNIKFDKNNPNATPIGLKNESNTIENEHINCKNTPSSNSLLNVENADAAADEKFKNKLMQNNSKPKALSNVRINKEKPSGNENAKTKRKSIAGKKPLSKLQIEKAEKEYDEDFNETEMNLDKDDFSETIKNLNEEDFDEADMNSDEEHFNEKQTKDKLDKDSGNKSEDLEMDSENASNASSREMDSNSESNDEDETIIKSSNIVKKNSVVSTESNVVNKKVKGQNRITKDPKLAVKPQDMQSANKSQDIQARLNAIAGNSQKFNMKRNRELKTKANSTKKSNNLKAVTMLNLDELQDLDEIPIATTNDVAEETEENKRKKDTFFLGKGGEVLSESDNEDSTNAGPDKGRPAFKKRKFDSFDGKPSGDFFKKSFPSDSSQNPRSNFREKDFQRNQRSSNFEDRNNSFKNKEKNFDFKGKGFKNKSFEENFPTKQLKRNAHTEIRNKEHFQKNKPSTSIKNSTADEKPLHPSWEAKKKLKEVSKSKFQGKRIVFDD